MSESTTREPRGRLAALGRALHRRRRPALVLSFLAVIAALALGGPAFGLLDAEDDFDDPAAEAIQARETLARATGANASADVVALVELPAPARSAEGQARIDEVERLLDVPGVARVERFEPGGDPRFVSRRGTSTYLMATFAADAEGTGDRIEARLGEEPGVALGGAVFANQQVGEQVSEDIARAEAFVVPLILALSIFVFRGFVAGLLPFAVGMGTVGVSFLVMRLIDAAEPMSIYALNLITGLGLGLAIDYSLFMVSRFREELERGRDTAGALAATMATAGRTVLFSAVTVAAALAALLVFPLKFLYSMGVGGAVCALAAALVSLTLLPALLAALGPRVNALSPRRWRRAGRREAAGERSGFWYRLSQGVMRRPGTTAIAAAAVLIVLGLPATGIQFTGVDASILPRDLSARQVSDALERDFALDSTSPVFAVVPPGEAGRAEVEAYAQRLGGLEGIAAPPQVSPAGEGWRIDVVARGDGLSEEAEALVRDIRDVRAPFPVDVGGETAQFIDQQASLADSLPLAVGILATTTLVILFLMTGSVVLPVKALLMNLLTLSAAFGLLVLIFQDGRLEGLLDYTSQGALESSQPILLFAVAFGLSTDYGVFLLTRIKEAHDRGVPNDEAVALGIQRTGRIVTFAALLFMLAIGAFVTSEIIFIKQLGLGTALAVLIDATIVRALLVPSLMKLLGRWNWWAPRPLARLHARIGLGEGEPVRA